MCVCVRARLLCDIMSLCHGVCCTSCACRVCGTHSCECMHRYICACILYYIHVRDLVCTCSECISVCVCVEWPRLCCWIYSRMMIHSLTRIPFLVSTVRTPWGKTSQTLAYNISTQTQSQLGYHCYFTGLPLNSNRCYMSIVLCLQILSLRSRPCMGSVLIFRILRIREMWFHSMASSFFEMGKSVNDLSSMHVCV